jgi:hypothetical protein
MFFPKSVLAWTVTAGVVVVGGGGAAVAATTLTSNTTPIVHSLPVSLPKTGALPQPAQTVVNTVKNGVKQVKSKLPTNGLPTGLPTTGTLPGGLTAPQCTMVPVSGLPALPALPTSKLSVVSTVEKKLQVGNVPYCAVDETISDPAGNTYTLRTLAGPSGLTAGGAATVLGLPSTGGATNIGGTTGLSLAGGGALVWVQRPGLALALSGSNAVSPTALLGLASALQNQ